MSKPKPEVKLTQPISATHQYPELVDATELLFLDPSLTIPEPNKSLLARFKAIWNSFLDRIKFD